MAIAVFSRAWYAAAFCFLAPLFMGADSPGTETYGGATGEEAIALYGDPSRSTEAEPRALPAPPTRSSDNRAFSLLRSDDSVGACDLLVTLTSGEKICYWVHW